MLSFAIGMLWAVSFVQANQTPNLACIERMDTPTYPPLARQAQVEGTIVATVKLDNGAKPTSLEQTVVHIPESLSNAPSIGLLKLAIEALLKKAAFKPNCANQYVKLIFTYELLNNTIPPKARVTLKPPDTVIVRDSRSAPFSMQ